MSDSCKAGGGGIGIFLIIFPALGYFVYDGIDGAFAMAILWIAYGAIALTALIPFIGIGLQYWLSMEIALPVIISFTGIEPTWLTTSMLGVSIFEGGILYVVSTLAVSMKIKEWIDERKVRDHQPSWK